MKKISLNTMKIYLASRSPRRRELLKQIGIDFELVDIEVNEDWDGQELAEDYVCRVSREKAHAGVAMVSPDVPLLAADTAVVLDGEILGKADTALMATDMLTRLSGKTHLVLSAVTVVSESTRTLINESQVSFRPLTAEEIEAYINTGEPLGKAGGYAIQGYAAAFIEKLVGSYSGVMGLPLYETYELLNPPR